MKNIKNYSIGLDIGNASVGYAVVDAQDHIVKFKKKNMIGARLFEEGESAVKRRGFRSTRRRLNRRKNRIGFLRELIGNEVSKKDINFFNRLDESFLLNEDKKHKTTNILFEDKYYTDADFHQDYPTIYHLRKKLVASSEKADIRLIYLALHHILKYRGHFLYGTEPLTQQSHLDKDIESMIKYMVEFYNFTLINEKQLTKEIFGVVTQKEKTRLEKEKEIKALFKQEQLQDKYIGQIAKAILGGKADYNLIYQVENPDKSIKIDFSSDYEESDVESIVGEHFDLFELLHKVYSGYVLYHLLGGEEYISAAMIKVYEKHKEDLGSLKYLLKTYDYFSYRRFFKKKSNHKVSYQKYIDGGSNVTNEVLNKEIKACIEKLEIEKKDQALSERVLVDIERDNFLKKARSKENASIPMQLHLMELEMILQNQGEHYDFIKVNIERIISILTFKIPYYVGPLNFNPHAKKQFAWATRKVTDVKIYPWNFDEIIDKEKSAEDFILRMTNKCTYLPSEDVIPKKSLLYSKYELLNELNKVRLNGELIPRDLKEKAIRELFMVYKTVTLKSFTKWLNRGSVYKGANISGTQKEDRFASSLTSYIDFEKILGESITQNNIVMIEEIISWITIFNDKKIIKKKLERRYKQLSHKQVNQILQLNYSGWSRLSKKLLDIIQVKNQKGSLVTIMDILEAKNYNFMQIINDDKLGFNKIIDNLSKKEVFERITYEDISALPTSPANKKGIWQAVKVVDEIIKIMGHIPDNIFIEMARSDEISKRTTSRINRMKKIYESIEESVGVYNKEIIKELKSLDKKETLSSDRLYLYFMQQGKCMYSGKSLDVENLSSYDIDHVIPRAYIKDDSFSNRVLVYKSENMRKSDKMLLEDGIIGKQSSYWHHLLDTGLITRKKYNNLTRRTFSENEMKGFINRQLVETRQISKHVMHLFGDCYEQTTVHSIKAQLNSDFRRHFECYKNRDINDFHHAHDAYISCVIGRFINMRFPEIRTSIDYSAYAKYVKNNQKGKYGYIIGNMDRNYVVWDSKEIITRVKKVLQYKDILISKKKEEITGEFYKQTLKGHLTADKKVAIKKGLDPLKYGGYTGKNNSYSVIIEYDGKKKREKKLVGIPVQTAYLIKNIKMTVKCYLEDECGYNNVVVLRDKIMKYQLFEQNGSLFYIVSGQEAINAKQLILQPNQQALIYAMNNNKKLADGMIDSREIDDLYKQFIGKLEVHYSKFSGIAKKLEDGYEAFEQLELNDKIQFVKNMIKITQANSENADLSKFKIKELASRMGRLNAFTFKIDEMTFIDQSVTGLFESRYTL